MSLPTRINDCLFDTVPTNAACRLEFRAMLVKPPVPMVRPATGWLNGSHSVNALSKYRYSAVNDVAAPRSMLVATNAASPLPFDAAAEVALKVCRLGVVIPGIAIGMTISPDF